MPTTPRGSPPSSRSVPRSSAAAEAPALIGSFTHAEAELNGVRLHWAEAGEGPLVVLLHGFPEFWYSWRHQLPALAAAGFRAVAPDLRGYNLSGKPEGLASYRMDRLTGDVAALIAHCGAHRAHVVGHDWGGAIAWNFPRYFPERVDRLVVLNSPHPLALKRELFTRGQLRRSPHMLFFQLPFLPERKLARGRAGYLVPMLTRDPVRKGAFSPEEIELYREALLRPGVIPAALAYYRAALQTRAPRPPAGRNRIEAPTLLIWGMADRYLGPRLLDGLDRWVANLRIERIPDASHWVQVDAFERVNELLVGFLGRP